MDYKKIYDNLICKAKSRTLTEYTEEHHIIPRCIGGTDNEVNLVKLTPEEHYVAHQLLVKIYPDNFKLVYAASMMIPQRPGNKLYGWLRRKLAECKSIEQMGLNNSQYGTLWINDGISNRKIRKIDILPIGYKLGKIKKVKPEINLKDINEWKLQGKHFYYQFLHNLYVTGGYPLVKQNGYPYSLPNLLARFSAYVTEFIPQNGKRRIKL